MQITYVLNRVNNGIVEWVYETVEGTWGLTKSHGLCCHFGIKEKAQMIADELNWDLDVRTMSIGM